MLNQVVLVGRIVKDLEVKDIGEDKKVANITLAVQRAFKNSEGEYETDFIDISLFNGIAVNASEYCRKGDLIGVRGRLQRDSFENINGEKQFKLNVIAEKVSFLSPKARNEPESER